MDERLKQCFGSIETIRLAVERIEVEGWSAGEALLRQALEVPGTLETLSSPPSVMSAG